MGAQGDLSIGSVLACAEWPPSRAQRVESMSHYRNCSAGALAQNTKSLLNRTLFGRLPRSCGSLAPPKASTKSRPSHHFTVWNRSETASAFSRELKAETRKNPSPWAPNPAPGVMTTWISFRILSKTAQLP